MTLPANNNILINQPNRSYKDVIVYSSLRQYKNHTDDLIYAYGNYSCDGYSLDFFNLSESDQCELIALKIAVDQEDADMGHVFYQNYKTPLEENIISQLINMLKNPAKEEDYVNSVKKHLISYYSEFIQEFIDDRCSQLEPSDVYAD